MPYMTILKIDSLSTYRINEQFGTEEAHTTEHFHCLGQEPNVINWFGKFDVSKVPGAGAHAASTGLAARGALNDTLTRVHQSTELWTASLHRVGVLDAIRDCHRHALLQRGEVKGGAGDSSTVSVRV